MLLPLVASDRFLIGMGLWLTWPILFFPTKINATFITNKPPVTNTQRGWFQQQTSYRANLLVIASSLSPSSPDSSLPAAPPPSAVPGLDGKRILPYKILSRGLPSTPVPAVYAVMNQQQKQSQPSSSGMGWTDTVVHVGVTQDLKSALQCHWDQHGPEQVAYIRALSFAEPLQPLVMQRMAQQWKEQAQEAGAVLDQSWADDVLSYLYADDDTTDDDDDDDDDVYDHDNGANPAMIVSPFDSSSSSTSATTSAVTTTATTSTTTTLHDDTNGLLEFTVANVDKVLDEVRPYLIADGGNVVVDQVDINTRTVLLKLEGACGSCPSSTITMQMGIERVLRENFANVTVRRVDDDTGPKVLTLEKVQQEVNRLGAAVSAMGGKVQVSKVDSETGTVQILYRGPSKVRQGLELAIRDIPLVMNVEFVDGE